LDLADVPPEIEWFANITNPRTRRAYQNDLKDFMRFMSITDPEVFRVVTRAHLIAWRKELEGRGCEGSTIRRKLSAVSSLFEYLCERNAVVHNPVKGVKRPKVTNANEGLTPALSDEQARMLLDAPPANTLKGQQFPLNVSASTVFWPFGHPLCSTAGLSTTTSSKIARS
jgi:integrase/recombinase XerD